MLKKVNAKEVIKNMLERFEDLKYWVEKLSEEIAERDLEGAQKTLQTILLTIPTADDVDCDVDCEDCIRLPYCWLESQT